MLCIEYREGFPLLGYTDHGLELAMRYAAEEWLSVLRSRVQPVAEGAALELPFLMSSLPATGARIRRPRAGCSARAFSAGCFRP